MFLRISRPKQLLAFFLTFSFLTPTYVSRAETVRIAQIVDGDTIKLASGKYVRLLQIDTPEMRGSECYAQEARVALAKILTKGGTLRLTTDPNLDEVDSYGRLLRYLFIGKVNVNLQMVKEGAASPYFFRKELGRYSKQLLAAAQNAKSNNLGLWSACPGTKLDPHSALTTTYGQSEPSPSTEAGNNCDPNYQGCIPLFPPDLDCPDIKSKGLAPVRVIGRDVHRLDRDGDGIGCD